MVSAKQAVLPRLLFQHVETARHLGPGSKVAGMALRELLAKRKCQGKELACRHSLAGSWVLVPVCVILPQLDKRPEAEL